jgi:ABC-2 type transport system ATP-binding protein
VATTLSPSAAPTPSHAARTDQPVVACQRVTKVFRDFWLRQHAKAVDALDLAIYPREVFGLLGPNGSGKSTTIKMILGLLRPTSGRVAVFGKPPTDVATKKRIGYLPEESYLYPFLNARETLDYYAKLFELDQRTRTRRIDELLDMVGLTHAQHRPVKDYSKGMQRRIGIAQALINDPDLLILDEPTTGLDPIGTRQVKDLILELGRRGKTIILSSHLLADVEDCVDRMVILYGGKIRREGTCDALLSRHERTTIEADELDEDTVSAIDRLIRERSGGAKSIRRVAAPRQKLEELFVGIVEQARAERLETSGATNAGATAAFLKAEEEQGQALLERLTRADVPSSDGTPSGTAAAPRPASQDAGPDSGLQSGPRPDATLLDDLVAGRATSPTPVPASRSAIPNPLDPASTPTPEDNAPTGEVDRSLLDNLLGGGPRSDPARHTPDTGGRR